MRKREHIGSQLCICRKRFFDQDIPAMFNTKFSEFMMARMGRSDVHQINGLIGGKLFVASIRFFKTELLGKSLGLRFVAGGNGIAFYTHAPGF